MIRLLEIQDYYKGYMTLINTFTRTPEEKSFEEFEKAVSNIFSQNSEVFVIEQNGKIISSIHLLYEYKLHNNFKLVCHIEDLVTDSAYRNQGHASALLDFAIEKAKEKHCYKIVLCSNESNKDFYVKNGFALKGCELSKYI